MTKKAAGKKTKSRKASASNRAAVKRKNKPGRSWRGWLGRLILLGFVLLGGFVIYCDAIIQKKFEGQRWVVPARVHARALDLISGKQLSVASLESELKLLGYRNSVKATRPGDYERYGDYYFIHTRPFVFVDGAQPAREISFRIEQDLIRGLQDHVTGEPLQRMRLDPLVIGQIFPGHREDRLLVRLEQAPPELVQALLATEDRNFFKHHGVSPRGIARALWRDITAGKREGGSTLTQQLVKNYFLTSERTLSRKFQELIMAVLLELRYDKQEILEAYLNEVFLGQDGPRAIHGFGLAAHYYFDKSLERLTPAQSALLVAMVNGPSRFHPRRNPARAKARRDLVLQLMANEGHLDEQDRKYEQSSSLGVVPQPSLKLSRVPAFMDLVKRELTRDYSPDQLQGDGLQIFTSLDPQVQQHTEKAVASRLAQLEASGRANKKSLQAAAIVTSSLDGRVLALVADRQPGFAGFNRALDARRQVGSLIKPFVALAALQEPERFSLLTPLKDDPLALKTANGNVWEPQNYDHKNHGIVPLHAALTHSYNRPMARLGLAVGIDRVAGQIRELGFSRTLNAYPSLALGAVEMSPLEILSLYQVLATGGYKVRPSAITGVTSATGAALNRYPVTARAVADEGAVYLLANNLQEVVASGTGKALNRRLGGLALAGKTGTTDDLRDSWFAGFSGEHLGVVWVGRDDNKAAGVTGASGAMKVFGDIFSQLDTRPLRLAQPTGVEIVWVDPGSGKLSGPRCHDALLMPFINGHAPKDLADCR